MFIVKHIQMFAVYARACRTRVSFKVPERTRVNM